MMYKHTKTAREGNGYDIPHVQSRRISIFSPPQSAEATTPDYVYSPHYCVLQQIFTPRTVLHVSQGVVHDQAQNRRKISQTGLWRAKRSTHSGVALARKRTGLPRRTYNDAEPAPAAGASLARVQSLQPAFYTCAPRTPANWVPGTAFCACVRALAEEMGGGAALRVL